MKTNELMIGDWVNYRPGWIDEDSGKVVYESGTGFPVRVEFIYNCRGGEGLIQYNDGENDGIEAAEYELFPIPLTPETLEKNEIKLLEVGDNGVATPAKYRNRFEKWQIHTQWKDTYLWYDRTTKRWNLHDMNGAQFTFVHEFQHALRLCGIEKEIEV